VKCVLKKTEKGIVVGSVENKSPCLATSSASPFLKGASLSFLFGLVVMYGKFEVKKGELLSCKIQLPLF
jgi:hypothetical protein